MSVLPAGIPTAHAKTSGFVVTQDTGDLFGLYVKVRYIITHPGDLAKYTGLVGAQNVLPASVIAVSQMVTDTRWIVLRSSGNIFGLYWAYLKLVKLVDTGLQAQFTCNSITSILFGGMTITNRVTCDSQFSAVFMGEPHDSFHVDCVSPRVFTGVGLLLGSFSVAFISGRIFTATQSPRSYFIRNSVTSIQFFVRGGQIPDCYYDNGAIEYSAIRNYVF